MFGPFSADKAVEYERLSDDVPGETKDFIELGDY